MFTSSRCTIGTIPGPVVLGLLIDKSCLLWEDSCDGSRTCWLYQNSELSLVFFFITLLANVGGLIFLLGALLSYRTPDGKGGADGKYDTLENENNTDSLWSQFPTSFAGCSFILLLLENEDNTDGLWPKWSYPVSGKHCAMLSHLIVVRPGSAREGRMPDRKAGADGGKYDKLENEDNTDGLWLKWLYPVSHQLCSLILFLLDQDELVRAVLWKLFQKEDELIESLKLQSDEWTV